MCRRAFLKDYTRILQNAKAKKELAEYQSARNAVSVNKTVSFGVVPFVGIVLFGAHYKFPTKYVQQRQ